MTSFNREATSRHHVAAPRPPVRSILKLAKPALPSVLGRSFFLLDSSMRQAALGIRVSASVGSALSCRRLL